MKSRTPSRATQWLLTVSIAFLSLLGISTEARAERDPQCFPYERYEREFLSQFSVEYRDPSMTYAHCELNNAAYLVAKAFFYLKDLPPLDQSHPLDRHILGSRPIDYLTSKIKRLTFETGTKECAEGNLAYYNLNQPGPIHICQYGARSKEFRQPIAVAATLLHETRHSENRLWRHVKCVNEPLASRNEELCDPVYGVGAWGVEAEFYLKISRTAALSEADRKLARQQAIETLMTAFNESPFGTRPGVMMKQQNGTLVFTDGEKTEVMATGLPTDAIIATWIKPRSLSFVSLYRPAQAQPLTYSFAERKLEPVSSLPLLAEHDRLSVNERRELRDIFRSEKFGCYVYTSKLLCWADINNVVQIPLNFAADSISHSYYSWLMPIGPMIRAQDGTFYEFPKDFETLARLGAQALKPVANKLGSLTAIRVTTKDTENEFVLMPDKTVQLYQTSTRVREIAPGQKFERIYGPINWSRKLEEI